MRRYWVGFVFLLVVVGCNAENATDVERDESKVDQVALDKKTGAEETQTGELEKPKPVKTGASEKQESRAAAVKKDVSSKLRAVREITGKPGDARSAKSRSRRVPPPKGMSAHPDFVGARVGLIHTANVMGEVDPCG